MDPVTQFALGAAVAQGIVRKKPKAAFVIGGLAGMLADVDIFLKTSHDILGHGDLHRHFTHSLAFIPIGACVGALVIKGAMRVWRRIRPGPELSFRWVYGISFLGYATHGLLDACTSYGTLLYWPFSEERIAWNAISIVDPVYTLPLLVGGAWTALRRRPMPVVVGLAVAHLYLAFGFFQSHRALDMQASLAASRSHTIAKGRVDPTFSNLTVWRSLYQTSHGFVADGVRLPIFGKAQVLSGSEIAAEDPAQWLSRFDGDPERKRALEKLAWFASGYAAELEPGHWMDLRYSARPERFQPFWGIRVSDLKWVTPPMARDRRAELRNLWLSVTRGITDQEGQRYLVPTISAP